VVFSRFVEDHELGSAFGYVVELGVVSGVEHALDVAAQPVDV
jgi:hypothetical protein